MSRCTTATSWPSSHQSRAAETAYAQWPELKAAYGRSAGVSPAGPGGWPGTSRPRIGKTPNIVWEPRRRDARRASRRDASAPETADLRDILHRLSGIDPAIEPASERTTLRVYLV